MARIPQVLWEPGQVFLHPYSFTFPIYRGLIFFFFSLLSKLSSLQANTMELLSLVA